MKNLKFTDVKLIYNRTSSGVQTLKKNKFHLQYLLLLWKSVNIWPPIGLLKIYSGFILRDGVPGGLYPMFRIEVV